MENTDKKWQVVGTTGYKLMHHGWKRGEEQFRNEFSFGLQYDRETVSEEDANEKAEFIVRACNNHDELVKRLAWAIRFIEIYATKHSGPHTPELNKARAALAAAGEQS